ncbi:hyaluronan-binding protein 2 [Rhinophrynus dorsalis]
MVSLMNPSTKVDNYVPLIPPWKSDIRLTESSVEMLSKEILLEGLDRRAREFTSGLDIYYDDYDAMNPCKAHTCHHGECVLKRLPPYYKCRCDHPYHGPSCSEVMTACDKNPCKNGGICIKEKHNNFRCSCTMNYRGQYCEIGPHDCYKEDGFRYRGHVSKTESGFTCLPWDSYLLVKEEVSALTKAFSGIGDHNFCRNPDGAEKPWCYYRDDNGRLSWDLCDVDVCGSTHADKPVVQKMPAPTSKPFPSTTGKQNVSFSTCGIVDVPVNSHGRIIGGMRTQPGKYPWMATLQLKVQSPPLPAGHVCGGTLIGECWILTAGHCVKAMPNPQLWKVILGKMDLAKNESSEQAFDVEKIILNEHYRETHASIHYDIALMKLKSINGTCAKETRYVKTACLPESKFPPGKMCIITGWGQTETGLTTQLLEANVHIISESNCSRQASYGKFIDSSMVCAGMPEGGTDSCQGDSGGPLVCLQNGVSQLAGVVSWGDSCGLKGKPGVYTNVYKFVQWIQNNIKKYSTV